MGDLLGALAASLGKPRAWGSGPTEARREDDGRGFGADSGTARGRG